MHHSEACYNPKTWCGFVGSTFSVTALLRRGFVKALIMNGMGEFRSSADRAYDAQHNLSFALTQFHTQGLDDLLPNFGLGFYEGAKFLGALAHGGLDSGCRELFNDIGRHHCFLEGGEELVDDGTRRARWDDHTLPNTQFEFGKGFADQRKFRGQSGFLPAGQRQYFDLLLPVEGKRDIQAFVAELNGACDKICDLGGAARIGDHGDIDARKLIQEPCRNLGSGC